jgi:hypothetical protein
MACCLGNHVVYTLKDKWWRQTSGPTSQPRDVSSGHDDANPITTTADRTAEKAATTAGKWPDGALRQQPGEPMVSRQRLFRDARLLKMTESSEPGGLPGRRCGWPMKSRPPFGTSFLGAHARPPEYRDDRAGSLWCDLAIWEVEIPAELVYHIGFNPLWTARLAW